MHNLGMFFQMGHGVDVCIPKCHGYIFPGMWTYCNSKCKCGKRGGDCDTNKDCEKGLKCAHNVGLKYGYHFHDTDVCVTPAEADALAAEGFTIGDAIDQDDETQIVPTPMAQGAPGDDQAADGTVLIEDDETEVEAEE